MEKVLKCMFVLLVSLLLAGYSTAALTVYSTESAYNDATGPEIFFIDFNGSTGSLVEGNSFGPEVTFGSPEASDPNKVLWNSDAITDAGSTTAINRVGPIDGMFTDPVKAFGLYFSSSGVPEKVSLYDSNDVLIGDVNAPNPSGFFGVISDEPIKSFLIDNGDANAGPDRFFIDDFRANDLIVYVSLDIKPTSCPNPVNVKSKGVLPVAILGSEDFDVAQIDVATIELIGVSPIRSSYEDVATVLVDVNECECITEGPDGFMDLTLKFKTQEIVEALGLVSDGEEIILEISGLTYNDIPIVGEDCIVIRKKGKNN